MFGTMEPWGYGSFSPLPLWPGSSGASGSYDQVLRDREADGMRKTVLIQAGKNATSKERDEKRGLIYYRRGRKAAA